MSSLHNTLFKGAAGLGEPWECERKTLSLKRAREKDPGQTPVWQRLPGTIPFSILLSDPGILEKLDKGCFQ